MITCSPVTLRSRVLLMPICSTEPEHDGQRGKKIAEHGLHRERQRDAADAQAGDQPGHFYVQVDQRQQQHHGPHHQVRDEHHDLDRAGQARLGPRLMAIH
jgi:hypothetical protein